MLHIVLALAIGAHGIGHILFLMPLLGIADWGQTTHSWLFTGQSTARLAGSLVWLVAMIAFCAAAYGLWNQQVWWRNAAVFAAVISVIGLVMFWTSPLTSPAMAALIFDAAVLFALIILHLPGAESVGA